MIRKVALMVIAMTLCLTPGKITRAQEIRHILDTPAHDGYLVTLSASYWREYQNQPKVLSSRQGKSISVHQRLIKVKNLSELDAFPVGSIVQAEPDYELFLLAEEEPEESPLVWNHEMLQIQQTRTQYSGEGVRVAVIDTGLKKDHPDLDWTRIEAGKNYANPGSSTEDHHGHGTFVTGVIAAIPQNSTGVDGIAPNATIVPLKVYSDEGQSLVSWIVQAIEDAVLVFDCDIINISMGTTYDSSNLRTAIASLPPEVLLVAAAGNDGSHIYQYPASYPEVISVGFVDQNEVISPSSQKNDGITIVAPGVNVLGLDNTLYQGTNTVYGSGSSYAAPHVTAVAALAKEANASLTRISFLELITSTAKDLGELGYDTSYGFGLVQVDAFMNRFLSFEMKATLLESSEESDTWQFSWMNLSASNTYLVLGASYDGSGRMVEVKSFLVHSDIYGRAMEAVSWSSPYEVDKIKIFILSSLQECRPLYPAEIVRKT